MKKLASHKFTLADLQEFAAASGDHNPIHVSPQAARRLIAGEVVVHGMLTTLTALEYYFAHGAHAPKKIKAYFAKPVLAGDALEIFLQEKESENRISITCKNKEVASIILSGATDLELFEAINKRPQKQQPQEYEFADLKNASATLEASAHEDDLQKFSNTAHTIGSARIAAIMALSKIVGMHCPGLHSLFTGIDIELTNNEKPEINWNASLHSSPFAPLKIAVDGAGISGTLGAFVRPKPAKQASIEEAQKLATPDSCADQNALVIGGNRGIGEATAKLLAASGADVTLTYAHGETDAMRVANEISSAGFIAKPMHLDVLKPKLEEKFSHIYYFASAKIMANQQEEFDDALYQDFCKYYVDAFEEIIKNQLANNTNKLSVFYPSTIFVEEQPKEFREYVKAKIAGEELCKHFEQEHKNLKIYIHRLPRIDTDQTASLLPIPKKPALQAMQGLLIA